MTFKLIARYKRLLDKIAREEPVPASLATLEAFALFAENGLIRPAENNARWLLTEEGERQRTR